MAYESQIEAAKAQFGQVLQEQLERVEALKAQPARLDFNNISPIEIGMIGGDGIAPTIAQESQKVMEYMLREQVHSGKVEFRTIDGLTIENRAAQMTSIPGDVLEEMKDCQVTLKGPTHTPEQGDGWPNLESANVRMRKELDLFANVGKVYSMFEAIHGSAPRMVRENRAQFADTSSMIRAGAMLMEHIGFTELGSKLHKALDICGQYERKVVMTGRDTGSTSAVYGQYLMETVEDPQVESKRESYVQAV